MRKLAAVLMAIGILVGVTMGAVVLAGAPPGRGFEWIVWIGFVKLGLAASVGLLAGGAVVRRIALRRERRAAIGPL